MRRLSPPDKATILELPVFQGLGLDAIRVPRAPQELEAARQVLCAQAFIGFDTESRPTFRAGQAPRGPDVVQFATQSSAFILQMNHEGCRELARQVLLAPVVKTGFGLGQDQPALERLLGCRALPLLDLDVIFHARGYATNVGIKNAVALVFGQRFIKSKRVTTSNWSLPCLDAKQLQYAANDAHVALEVLRRLALPTDELPIEYTRPQLGSALPTASQQ